MKQLPEFPIGTICILIRDSMGKKKGTIVKIVRPYSTQTKSEYSVKILPLEKHIEHNKKGSFVKKEDVIPYGKGALILYGE